MKKGFTLIELLAVIVILAIIALISVPMILGIVEKVKKGALGATANGLLESATLYYAKNLNDIGENKAFLFDETHDGETTDNIKLSYKGNFKGTGSVRIYKDGKTAICIQDEKYYAIKNINNTKVTTGTGTCSYDEATNTYLSVNLVSQDLVDDLQEQLDNLQNNYDSLVAQKQYIVDALAAKGVTASTDENLQSLGNKISSISEGKKVINLGSAKTFDLKTNYATYGLTSTDYQNLTVDNFIFKATRVYGAGYTTWDYSPYNFSTDLVGSITYDSTTGIVTNGYGVSVWAHNMRTGMTAALEGQIYLIYE
ncbi:MAG: prepilin-type N-terminal cleavage/methylation domain-containing protein [Bacilli bacterium]|nr:prepilin-type N-terminal cleavage/methylation domain-containing protein [Bacilli bacterium]